MLRISKEIKIANKIKNLLNKRGFIVDMKMSKKTKSIYLKIDNGACSGIRISDHKNKQTKYKYNVIRDYTGRKMEFENGSTRIFYNYHTIMRLIADIEIERSNKVIKQGYINYKRLRDKSIANMRNNTVEYKAA